MSTQASSEAQAAAAERPGIMRMIRAPFLSSIIAPMIVGTLVAVIVSDRFSIVGCALAMLMGFGLHVATNVYNDIYDHLQGTDQVNANRNEFSGGSGVLQQFPDLMPRMFLLARGGLVIGLGAAVGLHFLLPTPLRETMWGLFLLGAFFSKYYTAAPPMLASRGLGEVSVWFAFGPMAILLAVVSQGVWLETAVLAALPITGLSTLSILLLGQLIDLPADREAGKLGIAARGGTKVTAYVYLLVQLGLMANVGLLAYLLPLWWPPLLALVPYLLLLPGIWKGVSQHHADPQGVIPAAGRNVQLHLGFSLLFCVGLGLVLGLG
ncbi:MAG: prenyltransferase [Deltaproteobacteria bacterium]|jgi:1,4-dihydroxy-2-naphthoate octaprenyltransferase|nr:prenyltransferase [Deltaproteobacteria bacterium]MBW2530438.1 prenyltransferase [Deltaproteobacteria bacterium]